MLDESTIRIARYAYDRWTQPGWTLSIGVSAVWGLGTLEGYLQLTNVRFAVRYGTYNILPSLIWGTQHPSTIIESSSALSRLSVRTPSPKHQLWIKILCSLRGAIAGSIVLSNVVALTSLWQQAQLDYQGNIRHGREPPLAHGPTVIRLAGEESNTTLLSMQRERIWPVFERSDHLVDMVHDARRPFFWQVRNGSYSKQESWHDMNINPNWLFQTPTRKLLYLEADATTGDESSLALFTDSSSHWFGKYKYSSELDLDLKEVGQGFRRLAELGGGFENTLRVLLVDCTVKLVSGGGRKTSVRERVEQHEIADVIIDARAAVLHVMLSWLQAQNSSTVILETPSAAWFQSIQVELKKHGYKVIDRGNAPKGSNFPMLVYERTEADTVHTISQYLEQEMVKADQVCALLSSHDELDAVKLSNIHSICSSDIFDRLFRWVKTQALQERTARDIQADLDSGKAYGNLPEP